MKLINECIYILQIYRYGQRNVWKSICIVYTVFVFGKHPFGRQEATRFNNHASCSKQEV